MTTVSGSLCFRRVYLRFAYAAGLAALVCNAAADVCAEPDGPASQARSTETDLFAASDGDLEASLLADEEPEPTGSIRLVQAQALALKRSPELASSAWEVRVREGRSLQAGLRLNPELDGEMEDFAGSGELGGSSSAESTLALSQVIETRGKRSKRKASANLDTEVARWEYESARRRVLADVSTAFAGVLAAQQRVALSEELVQVAEASGAAVGRAVDAGATPAVERTRANVEAGVARIELRAAQRGLTAAKVALASTWGSEVATFERVEGALGEVQMPLSVEVLRARLPRHPLMQRWDREVQRRESVVELEDAQSMPNFVARAGVRRLNEPGENALVANLSMPFPLFDRNQGSRAAARSDVRRAAFERRSAEVQLAAQLSAAYQDLVSRYEEVTELRATILPSAREAFEGVRRGFQQGLFRNLDVLDAQRRLFELRLREIEALRAYEAAKASVEQLAGSATDSTGQGTR